MANTICLVCDERWNELPKRRATYYIHDRNPFEHSLMREYRVLDPFLSFEISSKVRIANHTQAPNN
jgi:hypothetical protein